MKKKLVSVLLAVAMVATLAVGCGSSGGDSGSDEGSGKEMTYWSMWNSTEAQAQVIQKAECPEGVPIVFMTHATTGRAIHAATRKLEKEGLLLEQATCYRVFARDSGTETGSGTGPEAVPEADL